jgi:hypothetical protein
MEFDQSTRRALWAILALARAALDDLNYISVGLDATSGSEIHARDKLLAEVALLLTEIRRCTTKNDELNNLCGKDIQRLLTFCDLDRAKSIVCRYPQSALAFGTIALAMQSIGGGRDKFVAMITAATLSPFYFSIERPPFRELEAHWLRARLTDDYSALDAVPKTGLLFRQTHPAFVRREDLYAKTHAAMYLTDFGHKVLHGPFDMEMLCQGLDHDLAWALAMADWDLLGELLMGARYCLDRLTPWHVSCEEAIDGVFERFGFLPAPTFDAPYAASLAEADRARYCRFHAYHTTIVYGLSLLSRRRVAVKKFPESFQKLDIKSLLYKAMITAPGIGLEGSGIDSEWFVADRASRLWFSDELIAEIILLRTNQAGHITAAAELASGISAPSECSGLRKTIDVLISHRSNLMDA